SRRPRVAGVAAFALLPALPAAAQTPRSAARPSPRSSPSPVRPDAHAMLRALEDAFSAVADRATPAVVNVSTVGARVSNGDDDRSREFFGDALYQRYFGRRPLDDCRASASV